MKKSYSIPLIIIILLILIEGNEQIIPNRKEINELELVEILGIDKHEKDEELVSLSLVRNVIEESGSKGKESQGNETEKIVTIHSTSFINAIRASQNYLDKQVVGGHVRYFILGEDVAKGEINKYMDFVYRDRELRLNAKIFLAKENTAKKILEEGTKNQTDLYKKINNIENTIYTSGSYNEITVANLLEILMKSEGSGVIPTLELVKRGEPSQDRWVMEENKNNKEDEYTIMLGGYAVLKNGKLIHYLSPDTSKGYGFLKNNIKSTDITIYDQDKNIINLNISNSSTDLSFEFENEKLKKIIVNTAVLSSINEVHSYSRNIDKEYIDYMEWEQSRIIKEQIQSVFDEAKKHEVDFIGINEQLNFKHPYKYLKIKDNWVKNLIESEVEVIVKSKVQRTFDIQQTYKEE